MQRTITLTLMAAVCFLGALNAQARIDLVTLPARDKTQLTVYNSADLTLVREQRTLTLKKGYNRLEFGWENTLIDPTSVQLRAPQHAGQVRLLEVRYPPGTSGSAVWTIESDIAGAVPVEITFFTSGINWRAFYIGTLSEDEKHLQLEGYITLNNHSGEDYQNASTRVIVGKIHLLDEIATLASRDAPYNRPDQNRPVPMTAAGPELRNKAYQRLSMAEEMADAVVGRKAIVKEGLSEYFLYSIEGTETIRNNWGKRLPSFDVGNIPVKNLYRYEEQRYGKQAHRLITFKNDNAHQLGDEPLPDGTMKFFQTRNAEGHLAYIGNVRNRYIPIDQEVELDFGLAREVTIEPLLMTEKSGNYLFDRNGRITGYDQHQDWRIKIANNRSVPVTIEVVRHFPNSDWRIQNNSDNPGQYEKVDFDTVKYRLTLEPNSRATLDYQLTLYQGQRRDNRTGDHA